MHKLRVGVIMGGKSIEHEVSFNSGRTVCDHLDASRYEIIPLFQDKEGIIYLLPWHFLHRGKTTDFYHRLQHEAQQLSWDTLKDHIDFMFIAMHGQYAEDGTLQGVLELFGIPYLGSKLFASALCMDKVMQKSVLHQHNLQVARDIVIQPYACKEDLNDEKLQKQLTAAQLDFPLVVKPAKEGSSLGVSIAFDMAQLKQAIKAACYISIKPQQVLIEEKIEGMEFSCICLTDYVSDTFFALCPTEIVPEEGSDFFCYDQKYMPGRAHKFTPARCSNEQLKLIQEACIEATHALEIKNISRIDGFLTPDNRVIIVDPNTLSGMGPASFLFREAAEADMNHTQVINHLIETELHAYGMLDAIIKQEQKEKPMLKQKLRVAVLCGGRSNEKEISLESGRNVSYKLSPSKYDVTTLFVSSNLELYKLSPKLLIRSSTKEIEQLLDPNEKIAWSDLPSIADFVFIALHGGEGENGVIQGTLEMLSLPYNGSDVLTSALCMDKFKTNNFLRAQGFDVPQALLISKQHFMQKQETIVDEILASLPLPVIIKPHDDGCSMMVQKATSPQELTAQLHELFIQKEYALIEECISGMELTVGCIGNEQPKALPPSQTLSKDAILSIEEKFLPGAGENQTPAPLKSATLQSVQREIERMYKALNCKGYARIDCFYQTAEESPTRKERVICIEVNTLPGITPATVLFHQAAEINMRPHELLDTIIQFGIEEHKPHMKQDVRSEEKSL